MKQCNTLWARNDVRKYQLVYISPKADANVDSHLCRAACCQHGIQYNHHLIAQVGHLAIKQLGQAGFLIALQTAKYLLPFALTESTKARIIPVSKSCPLELQEQFA
jgi:hypothetical protein